jgi:hypothetical protein
MNTLFLPCLATSSGRQDSNFYEREAGESWRDCTIYKVEGETRYTVRIRTSGKLCFGVSLAYLQGPRPGAHTKGGVLGHIRTSAA